MANYNRTYYQILGITPEASTAQIEKAFRSEAARWAERSDAEGQARMNQLLDAYHVLADPDRRRAYDASQGRRPGTGTTLREKLYRLWWGKPKRLPSETTEQPTLTQLMDFDWDRFDTPEPDTPEQKKAFWDELYFKVLVIAVVIGVIAWVFWLLSS